MEADQPGGDQSLMLDYGLMPDDSIDLDHSFTIIILIQDISRYRVGAAYSFQ